MVVAESGTWFSAIGWPEPSNYSRDGYRMACPRLRSSHIRDRSSSREFFGPAEAERANESD